MNNSISVHLYAVYALIIGQGDVVAADVIEEDGGFVTNAIGQGIRC